MGLDIVTRRLASQQSHLIELSELNTEVTFLEFKAWGDVDLSVEIVAKMVEDTSYRTGAQRQR